METLRDVLIAADKIDRYFGGHAPVTLWRARKSDVTEHIFSLVEQPIIRDGSRIRPADIRIERGPDLQDWVRVQFFPRGISTFDRKNTFKGKHWEYYRIEAGTVLPRGLAIVKDGYNPAYDATHYSIAPDWDMPLQAFKALLSQFAGQLIRDAA